MTVAILLVTRDHDGVILSRVLSAELLHGGAVLGRIKADIEVLSCRVLAPLAHEYTGYTLTTEPMGGSQHG